MTAWVKTGKSLIEHKISALRLKADMSDRTSGEWGAHA
jgi:hypothetical protein